jgi:hypothetical protein
MMATERTGTAYRWWSTRTLLAVTAVVLLPGCTTGHYFQLLVTVRDADTRQPIVGAEVRLDATDRADNLKTDLDAGYNASGQTGDDGRFTQEVLVSPYPGDGLHWWLKVRKDGYEPAVIDIMPKPQPTGGEKTPLPITVELKPVAKNP